MNFWCWLVRINESRVPCLQYNRPLGLAFTFECVKHTTRSICQRPQASSYIIHYSQSTLSLLSIYFCCQSTVNLLLLSVYCQSTSVVSLLSIYFCCQSTVSLLILSVYCQSAVSLLSFCLLHVYWLSTLSLLSVYSQSTTSVSLL